jgi:hypothetical protein
MRVIDPADSGYPWHKVNVLELYQFVKKIGKCP